MRWAGARGVVAAAAIESGGCGKDGKGATGGSGAQHGSVSGPLHSLAPARSSAEGRGAAPMKHDNQVINFGL